MRFRFTPLIVGCAIALASCTDADVEAFFDNSAIAGDGVGLNLSAQPKRDEASQYWAPTNYGYSATPLASWQLDKLEFDVLMPQSQKAIESFLGMPFAKQDNWAFWQIESLDGGVASTELAIRYATDKAVEYSYVQN